MCKQEKRVWQWLWNWTGPLGQLRELQEIECPEEKKQELNWLKKFAIFLQYIILM